MPGAACRSDIFTHKPKRRKTNTSESQVYGQEGSVTVSELSPLLKCLLTQDTRTFGLYTAAGPGSLSGSNAVTLYSKFKCTATESWVSPGMFVSFAEAEVCKAAQYSLSMEQHIRYVFPMGSHSDTDRHLGCLEKVLVVDGTTYLLLKWCTVSSRNIYDPSDKPPNVTTQEYQDRLPLLAANRCPLHSRRSNRWVLVQHDSTYVTHCVPDFQHNVDANRRDVFINALAF